MLKTSVRIMVCLMGLGLGIGLVTPAVVLAQSPRPTSPSPRTSPVVSPQPLLTTTATTTSGEATIAAETETSNASPAADIVQKIQEKTDKDITQPTQVQKSKLAAYLDDNPPGPLSWNNFVQHAIQRAVNQGVPPNIIVIVLLFPLIASLIAASRHIVGLRGFGIYIPAVLSVALVSTGIFEGLLFFLAIVLTALLTNKVLKKMKLSYLPRTALLLWTISLGILGVLLLAPVLNLLNLMSVSIFPILILVLLSENFLDAQTRTKQTDAIGLTFETLALAFISSLIIKWGAMQKFALTQPELLIIGTALLNIIIGKFTGLRVSEWLRFRSIIEEEE